LSSLVSGLSDARCTLLAVAKKTDRAFTEEVPRLLAQHGMSIRALAAVVGVSDSHLSRVLRRADYKTPSPDLTKRVAEAFDMPADYFPEYREAFVIDQIRSDARLRNELYARLTRRTSRKQP
jgi:transcriptional regulator with XRE-family HTH domain